ncbi:MAG: hypothetical protein HQ481_09920 [Alphaproteobacteria bacterium]|nr:hypothetical protein [Alphaproteobacteria bacterium]
MTVVKAAHVTCAGRADAQHEPVDLALEIGQTLACPICGSRYRRAGAFWAVERANWPKPV